MSKAKIVFFFDVDNTLLDNDRVTRDIADRLEKHAGKAACKHYWEIYEDIRAETGYSDYLAALQRYRLEHLGDPSLLKLSLFLTDYPFANRLFPESLDVLDHVRQWGETVILSDGDVVFQPRKVLRSGLMDAVEERVLIYIHKEQQLDDVERFYPANHYVMFDDKLRILTAMKKIWGENLTTVFVKQGHYATAPGVEEKYPSADISLDRIGDAQNLELETFLTAAKK
ncbi:MAG: HAD family hydrolase [Chthoniobacterales bacterium]